LTLNRAGQQLVGKSIASATLHKKRVPFLNDAPHVYEEHSTSLSFSLSLSFFAGQMLSTAAAADEMGEEAMSHFNAGIVPFWLLLQAALGKICVGNKKELQTDRELFKGTGRLPNKVRFCGGGCYYLLRPQNGGK
jgi:hypothetical protein